MGLINRRRGFGLVVAAALLFTLTACEDGGANPNNLRAVSAAECEGIEAKISVATTEVAEAEATLAKKESGRNKQALREAKDRLEDLQSTKVSCDQTIETTPTTVAGSNPTTTDASGTTSTTTPAVDDGTGLSPEVLAALTVSTFSVGECLKLTDSVSTGVVPFKIGALELPIPQGPRLWSDAYDVPLPDAEPSVQLEEFKAGLCANPHLGFGWGHFFAHMEIGGRELIDLNPWMSIYDIPEAEIHVKASGFIPLLDQVNPSPELQKLAVDKNKEWAREAEKLIALIDRFSLLWVSEMTSVSNYHLVAGGVVVGGLPEVGLNPNQESLPALILMINEKGACAPLVLIGINVGDRRPEEFAPPACAPTPPPPGHKPGPTTTTTKPPCTNCGTTTTPPPCTNCGTTTTTVTTPTTTTVLCVPPNYRDPSGKCVPPTTVPPSPVTTAAPTTTTAQPGSPTTVAAGPGATNTSVSPTTVAPDVATPTTASPVTNPPPPSNG